MTTRIKFYRLFNNCPKNIDFSLLKKEGIMFIDSINSRIESLPEKLDSFISSKRHLHNCLTHLKSLIDPKDNHLINSQSEVYKIFLGNIGRWLQILDSLEEEITGFSTKNSMRLESVQFDIKKLGEELMSSFDVGIYGAIFKANKRFEEDYIKKDEQVAKKDKNLYGYLVFYEFNNSADVFGGPSRVPGGERKNPGEFHRSHLPLPRTSSYSESEEDESFIGKEDLFQDPFKEEEQDGNKEYNQESESV